MDFSCIQSGVDTGENRPMTERKASIEILMRLPEQSLEIVRGCLEASTIFQFIFLFDHAA
jgi:hypothetical protein